jgi:hypothetical protein
VGPISSVFPQVVGPGVTLAWVIQPNMAEAPIFPNLPRRDYGEDKLQRKAALPVEDLRSKTPLGGGTFVVHAPQIAWPLAETLGLPYIPGGG